MPDDPFGRVTLGGTAVEVTRLGLGLAPLGGLYRAVSDEQAAVTLGHAWELGVRYFDVAPLYGYGRAEARLGRALAGRPRGEFAVSSKVGRSLKARDAIAPGDDIDRQAIDGREDAFYADTPPVRPVFDYSYDGVLRQVDDSLGRLGLDSDRCPLHPRSGRPLGAGHLGCLSRPRPSCGRKARSGPSAPA